MRGTFGRRSRSRVGLRLFIVVSVLAGTLMYVSGTAGADARSTGSIDAHLAGRSTFDFGCIFFRVNSDERVHGHGIGAARLQIDACSEVGGSAELAYDGSFTLTTRHGATLRGTVSGTIATQTGVLNATLKVTSGTGRFTDASGSVQLNAHMQFAPNPAPHALRSHDRGTLMGTLSTRRPQLGQRG